MAMAKVLLLVLAAVALVPVATAVVDPKYKFKCADVVEITTDRIQELYYARKLNPIKLINCYLARIADYSNAATFNSSLTPYSLNAIIAISPTWKKEALSAWGALVSKCITPQKGAGCLGPLWGIPALLKDNIAADGMWTTAGSGALIGCKHAEATVTKNMKKKGVIILGKSNLSQWAFFRGSGVSGWSSTGNQCYNPYTRYEITPTITVTNPYPTIPSAVPAGTYKNVLNPNVVSGSSGGSAVALATNLVTIAVGSDTGGSVVAPANRNAGVGIRPTVGLVSRAGVVPLAHSADTTGPMGRTVRDVTYLLDAMVGVDPLDPDTAEAVQETVAFNGSYTQFLVANFTGLRIAASPLGPTQSAIYDSKIAVEYEALIVKLRSLGAIVDYYSNVPTPPNGSVVTVDTVYPLPKQVTSTYASLQPGINAIFSGDMKWDMANYLSGCSWAPGYTPKYTLLDLIEYNKVNYLKEFQGGECCRFSGNITGPLTKEQNASISFGNYYQQSWESAQPLKNFYTDPLYLSQKAAVGQASLDLYSFFKGNNEYNATYDGFMYFGQNHGFFARARACSIAVPWTVMKTGRPQGIFFSGVPFSEGKLIRLGYSFEQLIMNGTRPMPTFCNDWTC